MRKPLVSILIPNYNYGQYLEQCLDSVLAQTYENIEIIFSDNNSTDNSYQIAQKYEKENMDKLFIRRNKRNMGALINSTRSVYNSHGEYLIFFSSDDVMMPDFVKRCVHIMEKNTNVGFVITHRNLIDEKGVITEEPSFYNRSCIIPGEEQAAVFMMAGIGVPTQIMYRRSLLEWTLNEGINFQIAGDWFNNFVMACHSDMAYIKEPLVNYRVHQNSQVATSIKNLTGVFEHYMLMHTFFNISNRYDMQKAANRLPKAIEKLGFMCLRYCEQILRTGEVEVAKKYLYLAPVFNPGIENDSTYKALRECFSLNIEKIIERLESINDNGAFKRVVSYDPPDGYVPL